METREVRELLVGTNERYHRWVLVGVLAGVVYFFMAGPVVRIPGTLWYIWWSLRILLVAVPLALSYVRFGAIVCVAVDFVFLFTLYYAQQQASIMFGISLEYVLTSAAIGSLLFGLTGFVLGRAVGRLR